MLAFQDFLVLAENYKPIGWFFVWYLLICSIGLSVLIVVASGGRRTRWGLVLSAIQTVIGAIIILVAVVGSGLAVLDAGIIAVLIMSLPLLFGIASLVAWRLPPLRD